MGCCHHRHPIQCIIPPHMIDALKENGDEATRKQMEELEIFSAELRTMRVETSPEDASAFALGFADALTETGLMRKIYDAGHSMELQKTLARTEGSEPHADEAVNEAYDGAGDTYKLFHEVYKRNSLDGQGLPLISSVHVRKNYNNAFWNGSQMAYGDGDGKLFQRFTQSLTVIGHELAHGVVQFSGGLAYSGQSGALNEHIADVFGCLTEQFKRNQKAGDADWLVGKEILAEGINGKALRSMKAPGTAYNDPKLGKDPQPAHMDKFVHTDRDNGGVHINSGIPNHAFYLLCTDLGEYSWKTPGTIWYNSLQELNNSSATFAEWAELTVKTAAKLHGEGSKEEKAVTKAWKGVGLLGSQARTPTSSTAPSSDASTPTAMAIAPETPKKKGFWAWLWSLFGGGS